MKRKRAGIIRKKALFNAAETLHTNLCPYILDYDASMNCVYCGGFSHSFGPDDLSPWMEKAMLLADFSKKYGIPFREIVKIVIKFDEI